MRRSSLLTWDQLRVGGLTVVALAVLGFAVYKLGKSAKLFASHYTLVSFVPNAAGLRAGSQVTVAGQLAGSIRSIDFLPVDNDTARNLRIEIELDEALRSQVRADSRVVIRNQGFLGDRFFDISTGTPSYRPLHTGDTLRLGPSVDYEALVQQASGALVDVVALTHDMRDLTHALVNGEGTMGQLLTNRALYDQLNGTLSRTSTLLARLQNPNGSVGRLLDDPTLYENLTRMIVSVDTLVGKIQGGNGTAGKLLRDSTLYDNLVTVTTRADSLVSGMTRGNGTAAKLFNDTQLYDQLVQAVAHLNEILVDIRRDPKRYTKGAVRVF